MKKHLQYKFAYGSTSNCTMILVLGPCHPTLVSSTRRPVAVTRCHALAAAAATGACGSCIPGRCPGALPRADTSLDLVGVLGVGKPTAGGASETRSGGGAGTLHSIMSPHSRKGWAGSGNDSQRRGFLGQGLLIRRQRSVRDASERCKGFNRPEA